MPKWIMDTSHKMDREGITIWQDDMIIADVVPDQHGNELEHALLIRAAPDLLEALKSILFAVDHGDGAESWEKRKRMARAAIESATEE